MALAPYWLMPTPWPKPVTRNVTLSAAASAVKHADRRPNRLRTWVPSTVTPPMQMLSTRPEAFSTRPVIQVSGPPAKDASG